MSRCSGVPVRTICSRTAGWTKKQVQVFLTVANLPKATRGSGTAGCPLSSARWLICQVETLIDRRLWRPSMALTNQIRNSALEELGDHRQKPPPQVPGRVDQGRTAEEAIGSNAPFANPDRSGDDLLPTASTAGGDQRLRQEPPPADGRPEQAVLGVRHHLQGLRPPGRRAERGGHGDPPLLDRGRVHRGGRRTGR